MMPAQTTKILYISLYTGMGGGEYGLYYLIKHLDKSRFEPVVLFNERGPLVDRIEELGVRTVILPFRTVMLRQMIIPANFWFNVKAAMILRKFVSEERIQLVQCSDVLALLLLVPSSLRARIRVVYSVIFFYEWTRMVLFNLLAIFMVDRIVSLSKVIKDDMVSKTLGLRRRMELIYWGVDLSRFVRLSEQERNALRNRIGLPTDKKIVGLVARYDVWKGHLTFLEAGRIATRTRKDLIFLIIGGATTDAVIPAVARYLEKVKEAAASFREDGIVTIWGHRDDIAAITACLDVCVCPSDREPFGMVVPEALACGIPVVASRTVGALEVVDGEKGVYVAKSGDANDFAEKIGLALAGGRDFVFSPRDTVHWQHCAHRYEALYYKAFSGMSPRHT